ncbi:hypothetical protein AB4571_01150 [Vibrio breoganii]|uniref:hypothetical protein n=1 Tax=Vibrio breoganii TaxID=553239 RepID=UPI0012E9BECC|nr:hypothetical protein [Vibrio breoganii]
MCELDLLKDQYETVSKAIRTDDSLSKEERSQLARKLSHLSDRIERLEVAYDY